MRRHEVSKVVLMNSADKLQDTGDGNLLGMTRTVLKQNGTDTWLTSAAATDPKIPLDEEFGAGHLNDSTGPQTILAVVSGTLTRETYRSSAGTSIRQAV